MKINGNYKGKGSGNDSVRRLVLAAALSMGLGFGTHASALGFYFSYLIDLKTGTATYLGNVTATAINDAGQVAGWSYIADGQRHAFLTGPNGVGMTDLGTLGGFNSSATGINAAGQVVGQSDTGHGGGHAFLTGANGVGMSDLGTLGGLGSDATGINAAGQVVGWSETTGGHGSQHAFITGPNGVGMTDLGRPDGLSQALGINDAGQVVGTNDSNDHHAFITGPNGMGMADLNSLVDLPAGVVLERALAINNMGQVIAITAIVAEPESYALMLAGLALIGVMVRANRRADAAPKEAASCYSRFCRIGLAWVCPSQGNWIGRSSSL